MKDGEIIQQQQPGIFPHCMAATSTTTFLLTANIPGGNCTTVSTETNPSWESDNFITSDQEFLMESQLGEEFEGASSSSYMLDRAQVPSCNGTFADCFFDGGDEGNEGGGEFLVHYSAGGRLLLQQSNPISYGVLRPQQQVCSAGQYSNCIVPNDNKINRPCTAYNHCKRAPPQ
ncbi:hypothetical protein ACH5RR_014207 [Cinchona calisaya]|uniref:Uncharacterized protein n=1 Tax=Cinchona calisaya TaxID=153742 RepID=A0ABD3A5L4_9GENT